MSLNAPYEEDNSMSDFLKIVRTPTYDSRVNGSFFGSTTDILGYEIPIASTSPGIFMESQAHFEGAPFKLMDPPLKRKSNLTIDIKENDIAERQSLLQESDYMMMNSPSGYSNSKKQNFSFEKIQLQELKSEIVYQNINSLPEKNETNINGHVEENDESDTVFLPNSMSKNSTPNYVIGNGSYVCAIHKHDSGVYSPNAFQTNPIYLFNSTVQDKNKNFVSSFKPMKQRTNSDSSSGFGSLGKEYKNVPLEKQNSNNFITAIEEASNSGGSIIV